MAIRRQKFCRLIAILSPRIEYTISIGHIRRQKEKVSGAGNPLISIEITYHKAAVHMGWKLKSRLEVENYRNNLEKYGPLHCW